MIALRVNVEGCIEFFLPKFALTMVKLKHFLVLSGEDKETELQTMLIDPVGTLAEALGKEALHSHFADMNTQGVHLS